MEGPGNAAYLSMGALWRESKGGSFTGDPEGYVEEGSGDGHLHRDPDGEPGSGLIYQGPWAMDETGVSL